MKHNPETQPRCGITAPNKRFSCDRIAGHEGMHETTGGTKRWESPRVTFTEADLAAAFTEWERRYREEPERFQSEAAKLLRETPETYGEAAA